jgi:hypothetical protein
MKLSEAQKFAEFQHELSVNTNQKIRAQLKKRGEASRHRLLGAFKEKDLVERRRSVAEFALISMAKERALRAVRREFNPGWIKIAQMELDSFIEEDPDERGILRGSIFYSGNLSSRQRLDTVISSRIRPRGNYDDRPFAAGVAIGEIVVSDGASGAFIEKDIATEIE